MKTPRGWRADAGLEGRFSETAGDKSIAQVHASRHGWCFLPTTLATANEDAKKLQVAKLRLTYGLTQRQAALLAALLFGGARE